MSAISDRAAYAVFERLRAGELTIIEPDGSTRHFAGPSAGPSATVEIRSRRSWRRLATRGGVGMAEGYIEGDWDSPDLDAVLDLGATHIAQNPVRLPVLLKPAERALHRLRDNTRAGSRRNIAYHYDLGNDFYRLWLDETMTYSAACFECGEADLAEAQRHKWDRMLDLLQPGAKDHVLEIGCGWGGFAVHAAKEAGCRVTGVTISDEQYAWAQSAVEREGLEGRVEIRRQDYRDLSGRFDAVASIEMYEAVGERWWPRYFSALRDSLKPGGAAAIQGITIAEDRFENYRRNPDFTQRHVFPGGMLAPPSRLLSEAKAQGLAADEPRFFGACYARTLAEWARRFQAALPEVRALGFDERFTRLWRYYLSYCRAGFEHGTIDVMQVRLTR